MPLADEYLEEIEKVEKRPLRNIPFLREQAEIAGAAARGTINAIPVHNRQLERYYAPRDTRGDYAPPDVEGVTVTAPRLTEAQRNRRRGERERRQFRPIIDLVERGPQNASNAFRALSRPAMAGARDRLQSGGLNALDPVQFAAGSPEVRGTAAELTGAPAIGRSYAATREAVRSDDPVRAEREGRGLVGNTLMAASAAAPGIAALRGVRAAAAPRASRLAGPEVSRGAFQFRPALDADFARGDKLDRMNLGDIWDRTKKRMAAATDEAPLSRDADAFMDRVNFQAREPLVEPNLEGRMVHERINRKFNAERNLRELSTEDIIEAARQERLEPMIARRLSGSGVGKIGEGLPLLSAVGGATAGAALAPGDAEAAGMDRPEGMPPILEMAAGAGAGYLAARGLRGLERTRWALDRGAKISGQRGGGPYRLYEVPIERGGGRKNLEYEPRIYVQIDEAEEFPNGKRRVIGRDILWGVANLNTSRLSRQERVTLGRRAMEIVEDVMREDARQFRPKRYVFGSTSQSRRRLYRGASDRSEGGYKYRQEEDRGAVFESLERRPGETVRQGASRLAAPVVGAAALGLASDAAAQENAPLERSRARVAQLESDLDLFSNVDASDPESIKAVQRKLGVAVDGRLGPESRPAISARKRELRADLETERTRLEQIEQQQQEASRSTRAAPALQAAREIGPNVAALAALLAGGFFRHGAVKSANRQLIERNRRADALLNPEPLMQPGRSAASRIAANEEAATRAENINEFWRQGGAGERAPFRPTRTPTSRGFVVDRQAAADPSTLFSAGPRNFRGNDWAAIAEGGGESAITGALAFAAHQEVDAAREAAERDPSERNLARLEAALNDAAIKDTLWRLGAGYAAGRLSGGFLHPYSTARPNMAGAASERTRLNQFLRPPTTPRSRSKRKSP